MTSIDLVARRSGKDHVHGRGPAPNVGSDPGQRIKKGQDLEDDRGPENVHDHLGNAHIGRGPHNQFDIVLRRLLDDVRSRQLDFAPGLLLGAAQRLPLEIVQERPLDAAPNLQSETDPGHLEGSQERL